jgi:uncharacterized protein (DUF2062 family)
VNEFFQQRIVRPIVDLLIRGITPEKIALSLAFGIVIGVFPVLGTTTLLCLLAAILFRLNLPAIQLVNYLCYPLQIALILPFLRMGQWLLRAEPLRLTLPQMLALAHGDTLRAIHLLWIGALQAAAAWMLVGPLAILGLYFTLTPMLRRLSLAIRRRSTTASELA